jgi:antitoxin HicB
MEKTVDYYMNLPYTIELRNDPEDEGWFVRVKELRGCISEGDTAEEALAMIQEAMELWLEVSLEEGIPIPEPRPDEDYSGKFVVRVPRSLHRELVEEAAQQGASLNQYMNVALARSVGRPVSVEPAAEQPGWPGLTAAVRHVLVTAGLTEEAGELDERLFASWASECLDQAESALQSGCFRDALWYLETLGHGLRPGRDRSPAVAAFYRVVSLLYQQVDALIQLRQGVINDVIVRSKLSHHVEGANRPLAQMVIQEERVAYSEISTERIEQLFERPGRGSGW